VHVAVSGRFTRLTRCCVQWILLVATAVLLLGALIVERRRLDRARSAVPLRIAVTGTRGKSTVTRLLAAVLRADGRHVLAKTTGSEPVIVLPDGAEEPVRRRGAASIIEQKRVLHRAAALRADAVVIEVMSLRPENHRVEGWQIVRPNVVATTNFRVDHTAVQGTSRAEIAAVLAVGVPPGATCFVPAAECEPTFRDAVHAVGATLVEVAAGSDEHVHTGGWHAADVALVRAIAGHLGVDTRAVDHGLRSARLDLGALRSWRVASGPAAGCLLVNAFAANDPESTAVVLDRIHATASVPPAGCIGLLNLRADRADRTLQWIAALGGPMAARFQRIVLCGDHTHAARRRLRRAAPGLPVEVVEGGAHAGRIMDVVLRDARRGDVVFGFGNIGGHGVALVRHWSLTAGTVEA
jgi:gamma-polyglutamate synthase